MNAFLLLISFITGLSIMAMELSASRLIAPFFGNSLLVWTNVIGIVLIALSLGYFFGGRYADKHPKLSRLLIPLLIAGCIFVVTPWLIHPFADFITSKTLNYSSSSIIFIGSFLTILVLFAFPLFLLGMTTPFVIRLYQTDATKLGSMAGSVSAVSTIGSILGTFLPTLWLIPTVGTKTTILIFSTILIIFSVLGLFRSVFKFFILPLLLLPLVTQNSKAIKLDGNTLLEEESVYQHIEVRQGSNNDRYLMFNEGSGIQSIYSPNSVLSGLYYDYYLPLIYLLESENNPKQVAIIGLAGGTLSGELNHFFPEELQIDGVEIDSKVIEIGKKYFDLEKPNLTIHNADGHIFLKHSEKQYDLIVVDAYSQQFYIPWTMTTQEFWEIVHKSLNPNGILAMNINATSPDSELLQSLANSVASVFPHVYLTRVTLSGGFNYMLTASNHPIDYRNIPQITENSLLDIFSNSIATDTEVFNYNSSIPILTNDRAPIELLTDQMFLDYVNF